VQAFTYEIVRRQVKRQTLNHWHGRLETYPLDYQANAGINKVTALFQPRHARRYDRISLEIGRSMGGSVATSKQQHLSFQFIVFWTLKPCSLEAVAIRQPWTFIFENLFVYRL